MRAAAPGTLRTKDAQAASPAASEQRKTYWFYEWPKGEPETSELGVRAGGVFAEADRSYVGDRLIVRFAYPVGERVGNKRSARVDQAANLVLKALHDVLKDLEEYPPATRAQRQEDLRIRARLKEAFRPDEPKRQPLLVNVFIATDLTVRESRPGGLAHAVTSQIFVDPTDLGSAEKLQTAIKLPIAVLLGGTVGTRTQQTTVQQARPELLKQILLHEQIHALLIRRMLSANQVFDKEAKGKLVTGPPGVAALCEQVINLFLKAQEESFAHQQSASLYPGVRESGDRKKAYDDWALSVAMFLTRKAKGATFREIERPLTVEEKVGARVVSWAIRYRIPAAVTVEDSDMTELEDLARGYP